MWDFPALAIQATLRSHFHFTSKPPFTSRLGVSPLLSGHAMPRCHFGFSSCSTSNAEWQVAYDLPSCAACALRSEVGLWLTCGVLQVYVRQLTEAGSVILVSVCS